MPTVTIERRRRGPFGKLIALLFWGWQALMAYALISGLNAVGTQAAGYHTQAEQVGAGIGATLGATLLLILWVLGTAILGAMAMMTRGRRETVTEERP